MNIIEWLKNLLGGADEHVQNITDTIQNLADNEAVQNIKDQAGELGTGAEELKNNLGDQAQGLVDTVKDKLPK